MAFHRRALLVGGAGFAQDQAIVGMQTQTGYAIDGRIAAVDPAARTEINSRVAITPET